MNKNGDITLQDIKDAVELIQNVCLSHPDCILDNCPLVNKDYDVSDGVCMIRSDIPTRYRLEDIK